MLLGSPFSILGSFSRSPERQSLSRTVASGGWSGMTVRLDSGVCGDQVCLGNIKNRILFSGSGDVKIDTDSRDWNDQNRGKIKRNGLFYIGW